MKKLLFLFATLLLCCACQDEDKSIDPTLMPEATSMGKNTLGCLIDGWIYTSGRFGKPTARTATGKDNTPLVIISAPVDAMATLQFTLVDPKQGQRCRYIDTRFSDGVPGDGEAHISRMDGKVISGTFSGEGISEGRFDIILEKSDTEGGGAVR